jgi:hypothetical protein
LFISLSLIFRRKNLKNGTLERDRFADADLWDLQGVEEGNW